MHIEWDHTKFPRRPSEWASFISELARQQEQEKPFEDFWLEQKSEMDPLKSPGIGKIAKCILGMANRLPDVAAKAMNGQGLMVCGLSEGKRIGVRKTEDHELENALHPFLGGSGPLWTTHRLPADDQDREVLVIVVEAPRDGDPVFACLKESEGVLDGGIYIRSKTQTRAVRGLEHHALVARLLAGSMQPEVDVSIELVTPLHAVKWGSDLLDTYIEETGKALLASLSKTKSSSIQTLDQGRISRSLVDAFTIDEKRSPEEFGEEVENWKQAARESVDEVARSYVAMALPGAVFRITNNSETYLKDVELNIHLEGAVESTLHEDARKLRLSQILPTRPRKYGPYMREPYVGIPHFPLGGIASPGSSWQSSFRNSGSVDVVLRESALRPKSSVSTDDNDSILFLPGGTEGDYVQGTWTLTAEGIDAVFEGHIRIVVPHLLELESGSFNGVVIDVPQNLR